MIQNLIAVPSNVETSPTAKRALFRIAVSVAMIGSIIVSAILFLQGGLVLSRRRNFLDIGQHPLHLTSAFLIVFGCFSLSTFIILTIGLVEMKRNFAIVATGLLTLCSFGLITFSIWSFMTISSDRLSKSINSTLIKELDRTQFNIHNLSQIIVENTAKMARLEMQHHCCGLTISLEDYHNRQPGNVRLALASSTNTKGRTTSLQKNLSTSSIILLPISCCNEKYRSHENNLCKDTHGNMTNSLSRYNTEGCYKVIAREKFRHIEQQGFVTIVASCLAVISCIALAAVIRLLTEGYQVVPLRTST